MSRISQPIEFAVEINAYRASEQQGNFITVVPLAKIHLRFVWFKKTFSVLTFTFNCKTVSCLHFVSCN